MALGSSSKLHPVSSISWSMYVFLGRPCDLFPCLGFQRSTSAISSSLLRQQCPANLILCCCMELLIFGMFHIALCLLGDLSMICLVQHAAFLYRLHRSSFHIFWSASMILSHIQGLTQQLLGRSFFSDYQAGLISRSCPIDLMHSKPFLV